LALAEQGPDLGIFIELFAQATACSLLSHLQQSSKGARGRVNAQPRALPQNLMNLEERGMERCYSQSPFGLCAGHR
jgi:hypothetical protein